MVLYITFGLSGHAPTPHTKKPPFIEAGMRIDEDGEMKIMII
jgi:hypothetical protein